ncbi:MAG: transposase [Bacteriovoracia bacterium]
MPRKAVERSRDHYYHITARSNNREYFFLSLDEVWEVMNSRLEWLQKEHGIRIAAFVLMSNHFHLLVLTPNLDIDRLMYFFMKGVTLDIQKRSKRINKIFGGRYKGSLIDSYEYLMNVYKYIYRNPVEAKMVTRAETYPYSSLHFKNKIDSRMSFQLERVLAYFTLEQGIDRRELEWINQSFSQLESKSIKTGLQKTIFSYEKDRTTGKPIVPKVVLS